MSERGPIESPPKAIPIWAAVVILGAAALVSFLMKETTIRTYPDGKVERGRLAPVTQHEE